MLPSDITFLYPGFSEGSVANFQIPSIESIRPMGPPYEPLTFRDVTEVYRRERRSKEITEIRRDFYQAVRSFLDELRKDNEQEMCEDPFSLKALSISDTMKKARSKVVQILEMRSEKILLMALRASSGSKVETDRLTREEVGIYQDTLEILSSSRSKLLPDKVRPVLPPDSTPMPEEEVPEEHPIVPNPEEVASKDVPVAEPEGSITQASILDEGQTPPPLEELSFEDHLLIRVLEDIPPFAGPESDYILSKEDVVMLPSVIARALVSRGKAVEIKPQREHPTAH